LVFKREPRNKWIAWRHIGRFLEYDRGRRPSTKKYYPEPHHPSVSLMDVQKDLGDDERNKGNRHGVELALLGFDCQAANQPHSPMINRWCYEATSSSGDIGSGCYLSMLAISLKPGITRNSKHLLPGTSLGFEYMKKGKYISEDERGGFKVAKVNLPLSEGRLRLFLEGKKNWLEEGLLVPAKKNKREGL
jgi:hypothetical protein